MPWPIPYFWVAFMVAGYMVHIDAWLLAAMTFYAFCHAFVCGGTLLLLNEHKEVSVSRWSVIVNPLVAIRTLNRLLDFEASRKEASRSTCGASI